MGRALEARPSVGHGRLSFSVSEHGADVFDRPVHAFPVSVGWSFGDEGEDESLFATDSSTDVCGGYSEVFPIKNRGADRVCATTGAVVENGCAHLSTHAFYLAPASQSAHPKPTVATLMGLL